MIKSNLEKESKRKYFIWLGISLLIIVLFYFLINLIDSYTYSEYLKYSWTIDKLNSIAHVTFLTEIGILILFYFFTGTIFLVKRKFNSLLGLFTPIIIGLLVFIVLWTAISHNENFYING